MYAIFLTAACLINMFNISITSGLNMISAYWHMVGVVVIVGVLIVVPDNHQSFSYVFTETVNNSGFGDADDDFSASAFWFVFGLGLLLSQYTITGFDASAHTAEETQNASRMAAVGMWTSVVVSVIFGWILLLGGDVRDCRARRARSRHRRRRASCPGSGPSRWARTGRSSSCSSASSRSSSA